MKIGDSLGGADVGIFGLYQAAFVTIIWWPSAFSDVQYEPFRRWNRIIG